MSTKRPSEETGSQTPWLAPDAAIPQRLVTADFTLTPLAGDLATVDHAAYMASADVIRVHSAGRWPVDGFTLESNRTLVGQHEADHRSRRSFSFILLDPLHSESFGCVYLNPLHEFFARARARRHRAEAWPEASAMVTFWLRADRQDLALELVAAVDAWVHRDWPFAAHVFRALPGEHRSLAALKALGLCPVAVPLANGEPPYLWFAHRHDESMSRFNAQA